MPVRVVGAKESAERDRAAMNRGISSRQLMQRAGEAAAGEIMRRFSDRLRDGAVVHTGPGNNGGDGWVVAGALSGAGVDVQVVEVAESKTPDAIAERASAIGSVRVVSESKDAGVVIDALLGTGSEGAPRGAIADAIETIAATRGRGARVVALDLPSGLDATTGTHSQCVVADITLSFGGVKRGSLLARDCCGEIVVLDIGLDEEAGPSMRVRNRDTPPLPVLVDSEYVESHVPTFRYDAHKGERKHLAIVGGGKGMPGAVVLAGRAALRSGIGLLHAFVASENLGSVLTAVPSALISAWPSDIDEISSRISKWADAILLGPGLGRSDETREIVERILRDSRLPVLLDADALNVFEGDVSALARLLSGRPALLTPHAAEFARLAGTDVPTVLASLFDVGAEISRQLGATVLLKGAPTVIFSPDGERFVSARGTAALGTGGAGDLLAGIAGTLLAQTGEPVASACSAAWIHGRAAELCGYVRGTTLEDVLYALPRAWNEREKPLIPPVLAELPAVAA